MLLKPQHYYEADYFPYFPHSFSLYNRTPALL